MNLWTMLLIAVGLVQLIGLALFLASARQAPEGFQDSDGFHTGRETLLPSAAIELPETHRDEPFGHAA
jgi:hypothetical protein